jgi:hypothetical protein
MLKIIVDCTAGSKIVDGEFVEVRRLSNATETAVPV